MNKFKQVYEALMDNPPLPGNREDNTGFETELKQLVRLEARASKLRAEFDQLRNEVREVFDDPKVKIFDRLPMKKRGSDVNGIDNFIRKLFNFPGDITPSMLSSFLKRYINK